MNAHNTKKPAPPDAKAQKVWDAIMRIARDHCLIVSAYDGIATLATPEAQRSHGVRAQVLRAHGRTEATEAEEVTNG